jgi:ADP-ribose pyrophosphatase
MEFPKILKRTRTRISPWVELIEKTVQFKPDRPAESYHFMTQNAYVGMLIQTEDGLIPIVRQYRPCVEEFTWEFPAGTVDLGETPEQAAKRELLEEIGLETQKMMYLGNFHPDTGRLQVSSHAFYGTAASGNGPASAEEGLSVKYVSHAQLKQMIVAGEFRHQLHLAIYAAVLVRDIALG